MDNDRGTVVIQFIEQHKPVFGTLETLLLVPVLAYNLLSVRMMARSRLTVLFENNLCSVMQNNNWFAQGILRDMHCYLNTTNTKNHCSFEVALVSGSKGLHEWLEDVHTEAIRNMYCHSVVDGLQMDSNNVSVKCVSSTIGKRSRLPIP